jgi:hypothetical protein
MSKRGGLESALCLAAILAGCSNTPEAAHAVSWYIEHPEEMRSKIAWCVDDAQRRGTPDCMNALEAKRRLQLGSQKDLAPIDWGAADPKKPKRQE